MTDFSCRICHSEARQVATVHGSYSGRSFELCRCESCGFAFIANPWLDYKRIYDERYYAGEGADPTLDYAYELERPERTVRCYEWDGIMRVVDGLVGLRHETRWLDFGCGNGGLVRYVKGSAGCDIVGFDEGEIVKRLPELGVPLLRRDELDASEGRFDVVTAIEVIEHVADPLAELRRMRGLMRTGGLLFLTTGNAAPFAKKLDRWRYVIPEIHISFFEPRTLELAMQETGFRPERVARSSGFNEILKYKVLKNLHIRRRSPLTSLMPAALVAAAADRFVRLSEQPIGWAV